MATAPCTSNAPCARPSLAAPTPRDCPLLQVDAEELYSSTRDVGRTRWTEAQEQFKKDLPDIELFAPILSEMAEVTQFLSCSSQPRIGYVREKISKLKAVCASAVAAAKAGKSQRRSGLWVCEAFASEVESEYDKSVLNHPLYVLTEALTPFCAVRMMLSAEDGTADPLDAAKSLLFDEWARQDSAAFGAGAGASASSSSASTRALPAAVPSSSDVHSLAVLAAARLAAAGQKPSGQSARIAAYEEEWALYKEGLNKVIASLAQSSSSSSSSAPGALSDMAVWAGLAKKMPRLEATARRLLAIQPTQTASERIFSRIKLVTAGREHLGNKNIELFLMSVMNVRALEEQLPSFRPPPVPVEDDPDVESDSEDKAGATGGSRKRQWLTADSESVEEEKGIEIDGECMERTYCGM